MSGWYPTQGAGTPLTRSPGTFPFASESCGRWKQVGKEEPRRLSRLLVTGDVLEVKDEPDTRSKR